MNTFQLTLDTTYAKAVLAELSARLETFDSLESVPSHIRDVLFERLPGGGFELKPLDACSTVSAGQGVFVLVLPREYCKALAALRAEQGEIFVGHEGLLLVEIEPGDCNAPGGAR